MRPAGRRARTWCAVALCAGLWPASLLAAEDEPVADLTTASLEELIAWAETHNPGLQAAEHRVLAAQAEVDRSRALPDPRLEAAIAIVPVETRVGPQEGRLSLMQTLPGKGKRGARAAVSDATAETRQRALDQQRYRLAYEVSAAYFDLYFLGRATAITQDNRDILVYLEQTLRKGYETGGIGYADLIRTQVEIGKLENDLRSLRDNARAVRARLNSLLHRAPDAALPAPTVDAEPLQLLPDEELYRRLAGSSPELAVLEAEIDHAARESDLAEVDDRVDWTVSLTWLPTGSAINPEMPDSGRDPWIAGVGLNLPLGREKYHAAQRRAAEERAAAVAERAAATDRLSDRLEGALYRFRNADREIKLYRDTLLPKAKQSFEASQAGVRTGTVRVLDLVDTQRVLLQFQLNYERALAERARTVAELRMLLGSEVVDRDGIAAAEGAVMDGGNS